MGQLNLPFVSTQLPAPSTQHPAPSTLHPAPSTLHVSYDFVRHPRARRYVIRVRPDGSVRVTIPRGGSKCEARAFVEREQNWIEAERRRAALDRESMRDIETSEDERAAWKRARRILPGRALALAMKHGLSVKRVSIRNQRWRWGSCSRTGHICLNWRLVLMPAAVRDYVILHELMHLKRLDHSSAFWTLVGQVCPDYEASRAWLRDHAHLS